MNTKQALIAAIEYFPEKEFESLENYQVTIAEASNEWKVYFNRYKPASIPGGQLIIVVPKNKGAIQLLQGE